MLLPIVLLLASAGAVQQADNVSSASTEQFSTPHQTISDSGSTGFVHKRDRNRHMLDEGIIHRKEPCLAQHECQTGCLSITAYVFSDGENPELKYVTDCPNLDVPYENKRARKKGADNDQQPTLKRTN